MLKILEPLAKDAQAVRADDLRNLLILSGTERELRHLMDTIALFDVDWMRGMSAGLFTLQSADVKTVGQEIEKLLGPARREPARRTHPHRADRAHERAARRHAEPGADREGPRVDREARRRRRRRGRALLRLQPAEQPRRARRVRCCSRRSPGARRRRRRRRRRRSRRARRRARSCRRRRSSPRRRR